MTWARRKNKYNAKGSRCADGHYHPSQMEAAYCDYLRIECMADDGKYASYEHYPSVDLGSGIRWKIDFKALPRNESLPPVHIEVKGMATADYKLKRKLYEALYGTDTLLVVRGRKTKRGWTWETI